MNIDNKKKKNRKRNKYKEDGVGSYDNKIHKSKRIVRLKMLDWYIDQLDKWLKKKRSI